MNICVTNFLRIRVHLGCFNGATGMRTQPFVLKTLCGMQGEEHFFQGCGVANNFARDLGIVQRAYVFAPKGFLRLTCSAALSSTRNSLSGKTSGESWILLPSVMFTQYVLERPNSQRLSRLSEMLRRKSKNLLSESLACSGKYVSLSVNLKREPSSHFPIISSHSRYQRRRFNL